MESRAMDMAEDKVLKFRRLANRLFSRYEGLRNELPTPQIIATKGDPTTGRKLLAFYVASILRCPLIKEHDFHNYKTKSEQNQARVWRKICNLASSQLTSGRSVVIDSELVDQTEFNQLKELSEITKAPLVVFQYRVDDVERLWNTDNYMSDNGDCNPVTFFFEEFMKKPTSNYIHPTNYDMGEIPKILLNVRILWMFDQVVSDALKDLRDYIDPNIESAKTNDCIHVFYLINMEDEYQRRCCRCKQLVSGSVFCCCFCRFIVHGTCSYFPESLDVVAVFIRLTLNLKHVVPEMDAEASCSCCKQLLKGSSSSHYYSTEDGLSLFDLDCLFLLPAKRKTKIHEHELERVISRDQHCCVECYSSIDQKTIFYYCRTCNKLFDVYCLWLPETAEFDRHRHSFKLSIVPREDSEPYYCEVCQMERDTERWIYYCAECDYPIHPRCIVEAPCLPRYLSTEILTTNKRSKEELLNDNVHSCSSHLSSDRVVQKELPPQHTPKAKELHLLLKESIEEIELPIIIATKGYSYSGRKLLSFALAAAFDCLLIDEDYLGDIKNTPGCEPIQVCYQEISQIALSQLQIGLLVVIDCNHSHESEFYILRDFAIATKTPLFIIDCKPCVEDKLEDFHRIIDLHSGYEYDVGGTPKLSVNVTTPTFDDIDKVMTHILNSISTYSKEWRSGHSKNSGISSCYKHLVKLGVDYEVSEGDTCDRCSKKLLTPILKCEICGLVLHKTCTELPLHIQIIGWFFILEKYGEEKDKARCDCCNEIVIDYAYTLSYGACVISLDCFFTPSKPGFSLHEHPMNLELLVNDTFLCGACGSVCKQKLHYGCTLEGCSFKLGVKCGLLEETVPFDRHRHSFHLIISPEHVSNQYYCEDCQEERDKNHWVYCCVECDYFIHVRCLVPTGGCAPLDT